MAAPATIYGDLAYLGMARESTPGTPAAPTQFLKLLQQKFMIAQDWAEYRNGNTSDISMMMKKNLRYAGSFQTYLYPIEGGAVLAYALGKDVVSGGGDPYTHTLTLLDDTPYVTFEAGWNEGNLIDRIASCKVAKATLSGKAGEYVLLDADLLGLNPAYQASAATVTFSDVVATDGPARFYDGTFTLTGPTDAATLSAQVEDFSIEIDRNAIGVYSNGLTPIAVFQQARKVAFKATIVFSGKSLYDLTYYGAVAGAAPSSVNGTGAFEALFTVAASPLHTIDATINNLVFQSALVDFNPARQVAKYSVAGVAYRTTAGVLPIGIVVKNSQSAQYTA